MNNVANLQNGQSLTNRFRRSPNIWGKAPMSWLLKHYPEFVVRWDLSNFSLAGTQTTQIAGPIPGTKVFSTTAGVCSGVSAVNSVETAGGAIQFATDTADDSCSLADAYPKFRLTGDWTTGNTLFFEGCVAVSSLVTNGIGFMMALAETEQWTLATGVPFNGGDAITNSASAIGFRKEEDGLGVVDTVVSDRATSFTNIGDAEGLLSAAFAFHKFGMLYEPRDEDRCIRFFQDNVELETAISRSTLQGYTNLDANAVGPIFSQIADSAGTAILSHLKWLWVAQLPPGINP